MARLLVSVETIDRDGLAPTKTLIPTDGVSFNNTGKEFIRLENSDTSIIVVTIQTAIVIDGKAVSDRTISVGAGEEVVAGPFPTKWYNNPGGVVYIDSATADKIYISPMKLTEN